LSTSDAPQSDAGAEPASDAVYDVAVIGAGPAGTQAAVSAAHQMRHVLVLDAGPITQRKGRAYWSKSVELQDAPVFPGITGPRFVRALREWMDAQPVRRIAIGGRERSVGIDRRAPRLIVHRGARSAQCTQPLRAAEVGAQARCGVGENPLGLVEQEVHGVSSEARARAWR